MSLGKPVTLALDGVSIGVLIGTLAQWLPPAAALVTIVYTLIQISETRRFGQLLRWAGQLLFGKDRP